MGRRPGWFGASSIALAVARRSSAKRGDDGRGRPQLYCSQSCRQIAYMKRNNINVKKIYIRER
jgi:hypothetical protein